MEITLAKARKLEKDLVGKIAQTRVTLINSNNVKISPHENLTEEDYKKRLESGSTKFEEVLQTWNKLNEVRYNIRRSIGDANQKFGVSDLLTKLKELRSTQKEFLQLANVLDRNFEEDLSFQYLQSKVETMKEHGSRWGETKVEIPFSTPEMVEDFKVKSLEIKSQVEDLEDKLAGVNHSTKLTLEENDVTFLKEQKVIL